MLDSFLKWNLFMCLFLKTVERFIFYLFFNSSFGFFCRVLLLEMALVVLH